MSSRAAVARAKREFPRISTDASVRYRGVNSDHCTLDYFEGVMENVSLGGVFIGTNRPLSPGTLVELEFELHEDGREYLIRARALVRWNRQFFPPRGMGLEFLEFEGIGNARLETWLQKILDSGHQITP